MKRLLLMRHAKAEAAGTTDDHARDLVPRGLADAAAVGRLIMAEKWRPNVALVSDARRTRRTFEALDLTPAPALHLQPALYEAEPDDLLAALAATATDVDTVLLIGHNPTIAQTASRLASAGDEALRMRLRRGFPTATLAVYALETWQAEGGTLTHLLPPP